MHIALVMMLSALLLALQWCDKQTDRRATAHLSHTPQLGCSDCVDQVLHTPPAARVSPFPHLYAYPPGVTLLTVVSPCDAMMLLTLTMSEEPPGAPNSPCCSRF